MYKQDKRTTLRHGCTLCDRSLPHVLEFGVGTGKSLRVIKDLMSNEFEIFGFDSFEGLPEAWIDKYGRIIGGRVNKGYFSTNGVIPDIQSVVFFKGWFEDTIPDYLKVAKPISLLHVDCDLYNSTVTVLEGIKDFIVPNTIIVFDEWYYCHNAFYDDHEQKAFREWVKKYDIKYEKIVCPEAVNPKGAVEQQIIKIL
jgi:hypothetical protein